MIYLVKYCVGEWEDYWETTLFATDSLLVAERYVDKFNSLLNKWKEYYKQFEEFDGFGMCIKEEYVDQHFLRWSQINKIENAFYEKIEVR